MIPLPSKPKVTKKKGENEALFEIESLYPGYGTTIGNSIRRVLLSSLGGAAVTKMKIEGVNHEFSVIDGVMEDVISIMLNLKELRFIVHSDEPQIAKLKIKGEKEVKGKDLEFPTQVEIVNPDAHIATITDKKTSFEMELEIEKGTGYSPLDERKEDKVEIGKILLDAIFTPIRRVNFYVQNMRVGERTDFDRLFLEIETDGTISPEEAFTRAVEILIDHFQLLLPREEEKKTTKKEDKKDTSVILIEDLKISTRNLNILKENKVKKTEDLLKKTEDDLTTIKGMGEKGIEEIKKALKKEDLNLKE